MSAPWFARTRTSPRSRRMGPISWQGWVVVVGFAVSMTLGAVAMAIGFLTNHVALGVAAYVVLGGVGAACFIYASIAKGDASRTVADYRKDQKRV
ncbi:MAG: hypothetical protein ABUS57_03510 [Pseudomonadota bacterium]